MLPILAMLTSEFILDAIEIYVVVYIGTGAVIDAANIINNIKRIENGKFKRKTTKKSSSREQRS